VGVGYGVILMAPFAARMHDPVLYASWASIGAFLSMPLFFLTRPAFKARDRAKRARDGSILRSADAAATWAGSCVAIALLGWAGQPSVVVHGRATDLSLVSLALSVVASGAIVVMDLRAWAAIRRRERSQTSDGTTGASAPRDVGLGPEVFEERVPASNPFRSAEKVTAVTVGNVGLVRRALVRSVAADVLRFGFCIAAFVWRDKVVCP
jgi:hypothetical protein